MTTHYYSVQYVLGRGLRDHHDQGHQMVPDRGIGGSGDGDGQTGGTDIGWGGWGKPPSGMIIVVMVAHMSFPNLTPELYIYIYIPCYSLYQC